MMLVLLLRLVRLSMTPLQIPPLICFRSFRKGVDGVDVVIGTSSFLREFSHGKDMEYITKTAIEVIEFVKSKGIEVRFSTEDSFRSDLVDLLSIYQTVDKIGVNRVGIADTVGCANPRQVYDLVRTLRGVVKCDIETHFHNDTGMGACIDST
jgi:homocitrate synthase